MARSKVLLIEDNDEVRENVSDILELAGYEALTAADGKEGIKVAISQRPDAILCDIMMPDLDGYGVLKILGEREDTSTIPFIFVTAKSEQEDLRRGMNLGADDYVTKPFYKDELLRVLDVRIRKQRQRGGSTKLQAPTNWTGFLSSEALRQAMDQLTQGSVERVYKRGEAIFREGEAVRDVFILQAGFVKMDKSTDFDKRLIVYVFSPGELFGYPEVIAARPYEHEAVALTEVSLLHISAEKVRQRLASEPNIADFLLGCLAAGLLDADKRMLHQSYFAVRKRCADTLLLAESVFKDRSPWPMSREELSQWAGTAKETFIRSLTEFRDSGLVDVAGNKIRIVDADGLRDIPS